MSNWLMMALRNEPDRKMLVRLDAIQYIAEGYGGKAGIGFGGEDGCFMLCEESFTDVCKTIKSLWREGESIIKVAEEPENEEA